MAAAHPPPRRHWPLSTVRAVAARRQQATWGAGTDQAAISSVGGGQ